MMIAPRNQRTLFGAFFIATLVAPSAAFCQETSQLIGRVVSTNGTAIRHAEVLVVGTQWTTFTTSEGTFHFVLPAGEWRLSARRIGFTQRDVSVAFQAKDAPDTVRIVLEVSPADIQGITTRASVVDLLTTTATRDNVRQLPALGEPDLLRVVPFLPEVQQPNDMRGALHLAGGAADETGMFLEGYPLQWPMHLNGVFGSFNVAALDRADVRIHHLPIERSGPLGGAIEIFPRKADSNTVDAVLTLLSGGATATRHHLAQLDILASGRVTYADAIAGRIGLGQNSDLAIPRFADALLRVERPGRIDWSAVGFLTRDQSHRVIGGGEPLTWGEALFGTRGATQVGAWTASALVSHDFADVRFHSGLRPGDAINVEQSWTAVTASIRREWQTAQLTAGVNSDFRRNRDAWNSTEALAAFADNIPAVFQYDDDQRLLAGFVETARELGAGWRTTFGARGQLAGAQVIAPRWSLSGPIAPGVHVDAAIERRAQFDVQLSSIANGGVAQPTYFLEYPRRSDNVAAEFTWRSGAGAGRTTLHLTPFRRWYRDRPLLVIDTVHRERFPVLRRINANSYGGALALDYRTDAGAVVQGSYTYQRAFQFIDGVRMPADWDSPHALTGFLSIPVQWHWTLNIAAQARSGIPTTPIAARIFVPWGLTDSLYEARYLDGARNSARLSSFNRVDFGLSRSWRGLGATWAVDLQALNAFFRENALEYNWRLFFASMGSSESVTSKRGLPIVPSLGIRATW
jgi:hypothetical protein